MKLNELGLKNEAIGEEVDYEQDLPLFGAARTLHDPGPYRFQLPTAEAMVNAWSKVEAQVGERIKILFNDDCPLTVIQSPHQKFDGDTFITSVTNVERNRGKGGTVLASDMDYLLKKLGVKQKPRTNPAYAQALLAHAGQQFSAPVSWSWRCNDRFDARFDQGDGTTAPILLEGADENTPDDQKHQKGCGRRMYPDKDIKKVEGVYPERVICPDCNAVVRAFDNIDFGAA